MNRIVMLDTGILAMVTHPKSSPDIQQCNYWLETLVRNGTWVAVPEITDYELRRELLRAEKPRGLSKLNELKTTALYVPITTAMMLKAAEFWATIRKQGKPTADAHALDGDMILAAQAHVLGQQGYDVIIATTNVKHLSLFVTARNWYEITE